MERTFKKTMRRTLMTDDYIMSLPEEIRQKILIKLHPFEIHRMCLAALNSNLKEYCQNTIWPILLKKDFPKEFKDLDVNRYPNLMWVYIGLMLEHERFNRAEGENGYDFYYKEDIREYASITVYDRKNFEILICIEKNPNASEAEIQVLKYFQYLFSTATFTFDIEEDEEYGVGGYQGNNWLIFKIVREKSNIVDLIYTLFKMEFELGDVLIPHDNHYIRSEVF